MLTTDAFEDYDLSSNVIMLRIGGYAMSHKDIIDWARRRFPGIDIYDEGIIPSIVEEHAKDAEGLNLMIVPTVQDGKLMCVILTHCADDSYGTKTRFTPFPLDASAVELGQKLFSSENGLGKAKFVTICDPYHKEY